MTPLLAHHAGDMIDCIVIGAGMSGLTAAARLREAGAVVVLFDKGRSVGGRMASRRFAGARFDHGAQHFSARSPGFRLTVEGWKEAGVVSVWYRSKGEPRHVGLPAMRSIPEHLASGLDVRTDTAVRHVTPGPVVTLTDGEVLPAGAVVVTAPLPQAAEIVAPVAESSIVERLGASAYAPSLAGLLVIADDPDLTDGHLSPDDPDIAWVADCRHKGVSDLPALTVHSTPDFARRHLEEPVERWLPDLIDATRRVLGIDVALARGHRWRFAEPETTWDTGHLDIGGSVYLAGEAFSGARVEGAHLSGLSVADGVLSA